MSNREPSRGSAGDAGVERLIRRAAKQGVVLDPGSARALLLLGDLPATRRLDSLCRLIRAARREDLRLAVPEAIRRLEACGGNVEESIRRTLAGGAEAHEGVVEMVEYAADRGVALKPSVIREHFKKRGREGTRLYIEMLAAIMDAASILRVDCTQTRASQCLSRTDDDVQRVIAEFIAESRRRADRHPAKCRVGVPPHALRARPDAYAGCGCSRCRDRLAAHMEHYIAKMLAAPLFRDLDRDEARAEAKLELMESVDTWPGGNFTGWFAARFANRVKAIYRSRSAEEREMLSLDAAGVLANDEGGRLVPLGERIPDRSIDVLTIVILRERVAMAALALRQLRADRGEAA